MKLPSPLKIFQSYPHQLSGGQKQRVMISMAMSCNPLLLIADEPTTALDVTVQKRILELIRELQKRYSMSVLFISHDLGIISEIADDVIIMQKGSIVESSPVSEIFTNPRHPYTQGLIACRPPVNKRLKQLPTVSYFIEKAGPGNTSGQSPATLFRHLEINEHERKKRLEEMYQKEPVLRVEKVSTVFPVRKGLLGFTKEHFKAVDNVSFVAYPGETLGLVGESGCGKTTLGRSILRLTDPSSGTIRYNGTDITSLSSGELRKIRKKIQIIFQDPYSSLNPRITAGPAILEPMKSHQLGRNDKERKEKVMYLLQRVALSPDSYNKYPHEFSGGQRQRICIARALAVEPELIICDESVSALDVSVQAQVLNLLNELKSEFSLTYIFISHDLSVVRFMSDRIMVMNKGSVVESGDADELYHHPQNEYTQELIRAIPGRRLHF